MICLGFILNLFQDLGFCGMLVFQHGDTLKFLKNDSLIDQWILESEERVTPAVRSTKAAKVSPDNKSFLFYEEQYFPAEDSIFSKLILYGADKKKIWTKVENGKRKISIETTRIYPNRVVLFITDRVNAYPVMEIIWNKKTKETVDLKQWLGIVDYAFSPHERYVAFHAKKSHNNHLFDYVFFLDLYSKKHWEYPFPFCASCKRGKVDLKVDDQGITEVIYKREHRIFSKEGQLLDISIR